MNQQLPPSPQEDSNEEVLKLLMQHTIMRWLGFLFGSLLVYWLFLPYADKWIMAIIQGFKP